MKTANLKNFQMHAMALVMTIMRVKASMMRIAAKHCKMSSIDGNVRHQKTKTALYVSQNQKRGADKWKRC